MNRLRPWRRMLLLGLSLGGTSQAISQTPVLQPCPTHFKGAQKLYFSGQRDLAVKALNCLIITEPKDTAPYRFLSDLYWWEGKATDSRTIASQALFVIDRDHPESAASEESIHLKKREARFRVSSSADLVSSAHQQGFESNNHLSYYYSEKNLLELAVSKLTRIFKSATIASEQTSLSDWIYGLKNSVLLSKVFYLDATFLISPQSTFSARTHFDLEPHHILPDNYDLSLSFRLSHYDPDQSITTFSPSWLKPIGDDWLLASRLYFVKVDNMLFSGLESVSYQAHPRVNLKFSVSGGRGYEGEGIRDDFWALSPEIRGQVTRSIALRLGFEDHHGNFRQERRMSLGAEWIF